MNKHLRSLMALVAAAVTALFIGCMASAQDYHTYASRLVDDQGELSDYEMNSLSQLLDDTAQEIKLNIGVVLADKEMDGLGEQAYTQQFLYDSFGDEWGSIVLMLVPTGSGKVDQIFYTDEAYDRFKGQREKIFDAVYEGLDSGSGDNYYAAISKYCEYLSNHGTGSSFSLHLNTGHIVGIIVAFLISLVVVNAHAAKYKKRTPISARAYMDSRSTNFTQRNDMFVREYTTTRRVSSSSSSRSGGGGGHRGGGHRSGGGGGRRR